MEIKEMQNKIGEIVSLIDIKFKVDRNSNITLNQLTEELGEIAKEINVANFNQKEINKNKLGEEIADVLFLLVKLGDENNIDLDEAINKNIIKLRDRHNLSQ